MRTLNDACSKLRNWSLPKPFSVAELRLADFNGEPGEQRQGYVTGDNEIATRRVLHTGGNPLPKVIWIEKQGERNSGYDDDAHYSGNQQENNL